MLKLQYKGTQRSIWLAGSSMKIGSGKDNDLLISGEGIGDYHAEFAIDPQRILLSAIGNHIVHVNGEPLTKSCEVTLGDEITLGSQSFLIIDPKQSPPLTVNDYKAASSAESEKGTNKVLPEGSGSGWLLQGNHKSLRNKRYPINGEVVIGRANDCSLDFSFERLSRRHAELRVHKGNLYVRDLDSSNGTYVNGKKVTQSRLLNGDVVSFDRLSFTVVGPGGKDDDELLSSDDLNKTVIRPALDKKTINQVTKAQSAKNRNRLAEEAVAAMRVPASSEDTTNSSRFILGAVLIVLFLALGAWFFL